MPQRPARVRAFAKQLPTGVADEVDDARAVGVHDADPALVIAGVAAEENAWLIVVGAGSAASSPAGSSGVSST